MTRIKQLALDLLDEKELQLADHLHVLLGDDKWDAGPLIGEILPIYWERIGDRLRNCYPSNIYRPLNYIHVWSSTGDFANSTRAYMDVISNHIEGCLQNFLYPGDEHRGASKAFGPLIAELKKQGILSADLASSLWKFNEAVNVPSKHFGAYAPTRWLDERTFSAIETVYAIVIMRKLSIQLFALLKANGISLPHEWSDFKDEWLSSFPEYNDNHGN